MFYREQLKGNSCERKTLSFTFDDGPGKTVGIGPGPKTVEIAQYLHDQEIPATFFCVGSTILKYTEVLDDISYYGHTIGNHTYSHMNMVNGLIEGKDIMSEISLTTQLIQKYSHGRILFRAPWGEWTAKVADYLNDNIMDANIYVGPFYWDIDGSDWNHWLKKQSAEECAMRYLTDIWQINKGIILMHDSSADSITAKDNNLCYETIKILVPLLKELGFKFVSLEEASSYV
ncbi:MAG: polysaccharide deacetylase family protein [Chitinophagaceae bacterium]|nr:polysaccharide deacetylase family protein [Chitinophagaceae bacterium]